MWQEKCPLCASSVKQIHRRPIERAISRVYRVHRYICSDANCGWKGLVHIRREKPRRKRTQWWIWAATLLISLLVGMVLVRFVVE